MLKVNIVVTLPDMEWIVGRLAKELVDRLPAYGIDAVITATRATAQANRIADIEYHANVYGPPTGRCRKNIGMFAHDDGRPAKYTHLFDGHVVLNPEMLALVSRLGAKEPVIIEQAVDAAFIREDQIVFGVAGSVKPGNPRKGEALIKKMVEHGYRVRAWGKGWPCEIVSDQFQHLPAFYRGLDYYVVTSTLEGGCTPIIECMAMGVPVISPRIGFAIRRPILEYKSGDWDSLNAILQFLTKPRTYDDWACEHAAYFRSIANA